MSDTQISYAAFKHIVKNVFQQFCQGDSINLHWNAAEARDSKVPEIRGFFYELGLFYRNGPHPSWKTLWKKPHLIELAVFQQSWTANVIECVIRESVYSGEIAELVKEVKRLTEVPIELIQE